MWHVTMVSMVTTLAPQHALPAQLASQQMKWGLCHRIAAFVSRNVVLLLCYLFLNFKKIVAYRYMYVSCVFKLLSFLTFIKILLLSTFK